MCLWVPRNAPWWATCGKLHYSSLTRGRRPTITHVRHAQTHTRTPSSSAARFPRPPINPLLAGSPLLLLLFLLLLLPNPPNSPAKLTAPSSVENESRSHYNRAGQIPLALSEIERGEQRAGGSGACPYQRERVSSADVTNPPGRIEQAHTHTHTHSERKLGANTGMHTYTLSHTEDNRDTQIEKHDYTHRRARTHTHTHT